MEKEKSMTKQETEEMMKQLEKVFSIVRILDVEGLETANSLNKGKMPDHPCQCYSFWNRDTRCANCISARVLADKKQRTKIEFIDSDMYQVISRYIEIDNVPHIIEMINCLDSDTLIDSDGRKELIGKIAGFDKEIYLDVLTGAYNRKYYEDNVKMSTRVSGIAMLDIDDFKLYNDTFGHMAGDVALETVVGVIKEEIRKIDLIIRYGGDEFLIVMPGIEENSFVKKIRHIIDVNLPIIENICKEVDNRNISKVLLVGRGSSEHALLVGKYAFEIYTDKLTSMAYPSIITLLDGKLDLSDVLTIGVSQCGEAKDVYTVLEKCQNQGGIAVSVTNEHECLMRNVGNYYINCECGKETSFTAAKSYMSQMVITLLFAAVLSHDEKVLEQIKKAPDIIEQSLCKNIEEQVKKSVPLFRNVQDILLLGRGFSYAVANETELKIMEASYTNAKAYSSCDYPHGPIATTNRFIPVIFFLTDEKTNDSTIKLVEKIKKDFSVSTLVVTNNEKYITMANEAVLLPKEAEGVAGVFGMVVFSQLFACLLSLARGYNPDEPIGLSKTTVTF